MDQIKKITVNCSPTNHYHSKVYKLHGSFLVYSLQRIYDYTIYDVGLLGMCRTNLNASLGLYVNNKVRKNTRNVTLV